MPEHLRHDTRNTKVKIVSLLPHRESEAMVHICRRKYEWDRDELKDKFCLAFFFMSCIGSITLGFQKKTKHSSYV